MSLDWVEIGSGDGWSGRVERWRGEMEIGWGDWVERLVRWRYWAKGKDFVLRDRVERSGGEIGWRLGGGYGANPSFGGLGFYVLCDWVAVLGDWGSRFGGGFRT